MPHGRREFWRDRLFWLAISCGPLVWLILAGAGAQVAWRFPDPTLFFWTVLVYPPLEEIIFRGGLQPMLLSHPNLASARYGITLANVITSILFAAAHLLGQSPLWAMLVFIPSLIFGAARDRYGGITVPVILHIFYNAGYVSLFIK